MENNVPQQNQIIAVKKKGPKVFEIIIWILSALYLIWAALGILLHVLPINPTSGPLWFMMRYGSFVMLLLPILLIVGLFIGRNWKTRVVTLILLLPQLFLLYKVYFTVELW
jgi:hypothetical protein